MGGTMNPFGSWGKKDKYRKRVLAYDDERIFVYGDQDLFFRNWTGDVEVHKAIKMNGYVGYIVWWGGANVYAVDLNGTIWYTVDFKSFHGTPAEAVDSYLQGVLKGFKCSSTEHSVICCAFKGGETIECFESDFNSVVEGEGLPVGVKYRILLDRSVLNHMIDYRVKKDGVVLSLDNGCSLECGFEDVHWNYCGVPMKPEMVKKFLDEGVTFVEVKDYFRRENFSNVERGDPIEVLNELLSREYYIGKDFAVYDGAILGQPGRRYVVGRGGVIVVFDGGFIDREYSPVVGLALFGSKGFEGSVSVEFVDTVPQVGIFREKVELRRLSNVIYWYNPIVKKYVGENGMVVDNDFFSVSQGGIELKFLKIPDWGLRVLGSKDGNLLRDFLKMPESFSGVAKRVGGTFELSVGVDGIFVIGIFPFIDGVANVKIPLDGDFNPWYCDSMNGLPEDYVISTELKLDKGMEADEVISNFYNFVGSYTIVKGRYRLVFEMNLVHPNIDDDFFGIVSRVFVSDGKNSFDVTEHMDLLDGFSSPEEVFVFASSL